ncbi:unnamed protein product [Sphagnum troendelagicum]|uniref:Peptidase S54 rhomboid domain-containing protein n=1 Tax=Sphagnum troendelagicum TaxID=128251 RepID=A0ABP0UE21_9BRYO
MGGIIRALVGMGGGGGGMGASWIAAIGSVCSGQGAHRGNNNGSSELSMRAAQMGSKPLALSSSRVGFLVAAGAALQLERFLSLTSSFMGDQFQEPIRKCNKMQGQSNNLGLDAGNGNCWHLAPQCCDSAGIPSLLGSSVVVYMPWGSIVQFLETGSHPRRKLKVRMAATGGRNEAPHSRTGVGVGSKGRKWTNVILGLNLLVYMAQVASQGRLLLWGAKVNSLINRGQLWRLITPSLLHANIAHLLVNSYSLNSVGPTVESLGGGRRFLAVYVASALASSSLSYTLCTAPSVGASGAIFGLVGALAVFLVRHKSLMSGGDQSLAQVGRVIAINMVFGLLSEGIDNWGHLGGLFGGAAVAWLVGPALSFQSQPGGGQRLLIDQPPLTRFMSIVRKKQHNS